MGKQDILMQQARASSFGLPRARKLGCASILVLGLTLGGCSSVSGLLDDTFGGSSDAAAPPTDVDSASFTDQTPVGTLYNKGLDHMKEGEYKKAAKQFDEVERQHPYSTWATWLSMLSAPMASAAALRSLRARSRIRRGSCATGADDIAGR